MAKKKKSSGSSASSLSRELAQIQANATIQAQQIANQATEKSFQYNAQEAATARQFNKQEAAVQRQFNSQEAKVARDWEERMSNTSHQREVADLKKAGLNPVLSANGGAQSYTTSSASANAASASPASAYAYDASGTIGQLASTMMQGKIGAYEADTSAKATRYAAKQSAAATRYAAAAQASAAKYAAAMNYQNQREHEAWQSTYMKEKYKEHTKMLNSTPPKNVAGLLYQFTQRAGFQDIIFSSKAVKGLQSFTKTALNNPSKFFRDGVKITKNNCYKNLNSNGKKVVNTSLKQLGINPNANARKHLLQYFLFSDMSALNRFLTYMPRRRSYTLR